MSAEALMESTEQAVPLHGGWGLIESATLEIHRPDQPVHRLRAVEKHRFDFEPTPQGFEVDITNLAQERHVGRVALQPGDDFDMVWERPVRVGGMTLGTMRSMAKVLRHKPDKNEHEEESVEDFELDELPSVSRLAVRFSEKQGVNLRSVTEEEAKAELEYIERGVVYRRVRVPAQELGHRIKRGVEDHRLGTTLTSIGLVGAGAVVAHLYKRHHKN